MAEGVLMLPTLLVVAGLTLNGTPSGTRAALDLLRECKVALDVESAADIGQALGGVHCMGYVEGIADAHAVFAAVSPTARMWCEPASGLQTEQRVRVVVKHLEANPEKLHGPARTEVIVAHRDAFPCTAPARPLER